MKAILGLGSNQPEAENKIREAVGLLADGPCEILEQTDTYRVSDDYLNAVVSIQSDLDYDSLNTLCKELEVRLGRTAECRAEGKVPIDIDVVLYDGQVMRPHDYSQLYFTVGYSRLANANERMILRTDNLVKKYGKRTVVNHVSIDVKQGEIVGLLGPNGAGKTTTFYMTVGLIQANEGRIFINDLDITKYPVYKRAQAGIGYLAQEPSVFRKMTVEDNIRSVLQMTPTTPEYQKEKLESLIEEFSLQKVRKNLGDQLSGGERRRTEIARCLAIDPKFIMLDEPFAGVDPIAVEDIQAVVYKLKEKEIGILITDHNAPETLSITDRAYLLFDGRILFQGTPEEWDANPLVHEKYLGHNFVLKKKVFS